MSVAQTLAPYSIEGFLDDGEVEQITRSIDAYKRSVPATRLQAGARGMTIHEDDDSRTIAELVAVYEPAGRVDINWHDLPRDIIGVVETAFYRHVEDIRRAYPDAMGPYGFTYVEYSVGQYFTAHVDGVSTGQVAGFGVTLNDDFEGGEFCLETTGSGRLWARGRRDALMVAPGHDMRSDWFRSLPRTQWLTRPKRGNANFYGSGLTHSSKPVTKGVLRKVLAFISSH